MNTLLNHNKCGISQSKPNINCFSLVCEGGFVCISITKCASQLLIVFYWCGRENLGVYYQYVCPQLRL